MRMERQALVQAPVPRGWNGGTAVSEEGANPEMQAASGPGLGERRWSRRSASDKEARSKHQAGLGHEGGESHAEPGWFGGPGCAPEGRKGWPDACDGIRVMEQLVQIG